MRRPASATAARLCTFPRFIGTLALCAVLLFYVLPALTEFRPLAQSRPHGDSHTGIPGAPGAPGVSAGVAARSARAVAEKRVVSAALADLGAAPSLRRTKQAKQGKRGKQAKPQAKKKRKQRTKGPSLNSPFKEEVRGA